MIEPEFNFDSDVDINPDALDVEWTRQAGLVGKYARMEADARTRYNMAKDRLVLVEARLYPMAKETLEAAGQKPTEAAAQAWVTTHRDRIVAQDQLQDAAADMGLYSAAMKALDHKRDALANLVRLLMADYFSAPVDAPHNLADSVEREFKRRSAQDRAKTKEHATAAMRKAAPKRGN
jgi:hypothetical protein